MCSNAGIVRDEIPLVAREINEGIDLHLCLESQEVLLCFYLGRSFPIANDMAKVVDFV